MLMNSRKRELFHIRTVLLERKRIHGHKERFLCASKQARLIGESHIRLCAQCIVIWLLHQKCVTPEKKEKNTFSKKTFCFYAWLRTRRRILAMRSPELKTKNRFSLGGTLAPIFYPPPKKTLVFLGIRAKGGTQEPWCATRDQRRTTPQPKMFGQKSRIRTIQRSVWNSKSTQNRKPGAKPKDSGDPCILRVCSCHWDQFSDIRQNWHATLNWQLNARIHCENFLRPWSDIFTMIYVHKRCILTGSRYLSLNTRVMPCAGESTRYLSGFAFIRSPRICKYWICIHQLVIWVETRNRNWKFFKTNSVLFGVLTFRFVIESFKN